MINLNQLTERLNILYEVVTKRFANAESVTIDQIRTMIDHDMSTEMITRYVILFAERVSLVERMLLLADLKAELIMMIRKGKTDENIKAACLRLGWELSDFMPGPPPYEKQIAIRENHQLVQSKDQADHRQNDPGEEIGMTD